MNLNVSAELLEIVKGEIKVTWSDDDTAIEEKIVDGMAFIQGITGPISFVENNILSINAKKLLKCYVQYDWDGILSSFEDDYGFAILRLKIDAGVERERK